MISILMLLLIIIYIFIFVAIAIEILLIYLFKILIGKYIDISSIKITDIIKLKYYSILIGTSTGFIIAILIAIFLPNMFNFSSGKLFGYIVSISTIAFCCVDTIFTIKFIFEKNSFRIILTAFFIATYSIILYLLQPSIM
ncbi:MAG: hypothetical protein FWF92_09830 [Oscillospiraceae bacterium]|nr:hypothetical protein [Oscillospiraceae bacterium]